VERVVLNALRNQLRLCRLIYICASGDEFRHRLGRSRSTRFI